MLFERSCMYEENRQISCYIHIFSYIFIYIYIIDYIHYIVLMPLLMVFISSWLFGAKLGKGISKVWRYLYQSVGEMYVLD